MSEFLDRVRADLDAADLPWAETWSEYGSTVHTTDGYTVAWVGKAEDAALIASAPGRLDRMERALRAALEAHDWTMHCGNVRHTRADAACDQCEAVCVACGERYPCPTVTTIREALGDE